MHLLKGENVMQPIVHDRQKRQATDKRKQA